MRISILKAKELLLQGQVVAIPTDTVYGLAASLKHDRAIEALFDLKGRPKSNPMVVQVGNEKQVLPFLERKPEGFDDLAKKFWPGMLTVVCEVKALEIQEIVRAGLETAAFRVPGHTMTLELLDLCGPLAVPSANHSGKAPATCAQEVERDFGSDFPVLDGGVCQAGIESTIVSYDKDFWKVLRQGAVLPEDLASVLGYVPLLQEKKKGKTLSSGLYLHLSHKVYDASIPHVLGFIDRNYPTAKVTSLGSLQDPEGVAQRLYPALRELTEKGVSQVWVDMDFPREGILATVAARLEKMKS